MPIDLFTGQPGNGKTALMMEHLLNEASLGKRPIFAGGIDGLEPGVATILKDPREWNAVRPGEVCTCHEHENSEACQSHVVPNGALIYIDEAWKWFGHLQDASRQAMPAHVLHLAEHRHRGIDMVWTTQMPSQLFPFARALIGSHTHVLRRFGTKMLDTFTWGELVEDVKSSTRRDAALKKTRALPSKVFGKYRSAFEHTIKPKIPFRVLALPALFLVGGVLLYLGYQSMKPDAVVASTQGTEKAQAALAAAPSSSGRGRERGPAYNSAEEYARFVLARVPAAPWTAPAFDGREVASAPDVVCVESGEGIDANGDWQKGGVRCMTEQGTPYHMPDKIAKHVARWGRPYNPFKPAHVEQQFGGAGGTPALMGAPAPAPAPAQGVGEVDNLQQGYGAMRPQS